jgi:membrane-bound metal-dependent hydrolase YbcI (DUF457 family)
MHLEPHAALGWTIGIIGRADRKLRNWCVVGAILPDIDAIPYVFGPDVYARWHHTFGHNVFLWAAFVGFVTWRCRSIRAAILSFLAFGSHLLTDAQLSGWDLYLFWPVSREGYLFANAVGLEAPINTFLVYASLGVVLLIGLFYRRTPMDIFSPKLDRVFFSAFGKKVNSCAICAAPSNQTCETCGRAICLRHATLNRSIAVLCVDCRNAAKTLANGR